MWDVWSESVFGVRGCVDVSGRVAGGRDRVAAAPVVASYLSAAPGAPGPGGGSDALGVGVGLLRVDEDQDQQERDELQHGV